MNVAVDILNYFLFSATKFQYIHNNRHGNIPFVLLYSENFNHWQDCESLRTSFSLSKKLNCNENF